MHDKKGLLSIGEMAKLMGVGVQALRYYERKNILNPAYVDPDSGYRYYSLEQIYFVQLITNCVGLDIPLKEVADVLHTNDIDSLKRFLERCNQAAERKIKVLQGGVDAFNKVLEKIELGKRRQVRQIYTREFPEQIYYLKPWERPQKGMNLMKTLLEIAHDLFGENFNRITEEDDPDELLKSADYGNLCRHTAEGARYYSCMEISKQTAAQLRGKHIITIPGGSYFCRQDESSKIEDAPEIFKAHLSDRDRFLIVETEEPLLSKAKINQPMYELRLIPQDYIRRDFGEEPACG